MGLFSIEKQNKDFDTIVADMKNSVDDLKSLAIDDELLLEEKKAQIKHLSAQCEELDARIAKARKTATSINRLADQIVDKPPVVEEKPEEKPVVEEKPEEEKPDG